MTDYQTFYRGLSRSTTREEIDHLMEFEAGREAVLTFVLNFAMQQEKQEEEEYGDLEGVQYPWHMDVAVRDSVMAELPGQKINRSKFGDAGYTQVEVHNYVLMHMLMDEVTFDAEFPLMVFSPDVRKFVGPRRDAIVGVTAISEYSEHAIYRTSRQVVENMTFPDDFPMLCGVNGEGTGYSRGDNYTGEVAGIFFDTLYLRTSLLQMAYTCLMHESPDMNVNGWFIVPYTPDVLVAERGYIASVDLHFERKNDVVSFISGQGAIFSYDWDTYKELITTTVVTHPILGNRGFWVERFAVHSGLFVGWLRSSTNSADSPVDVFRVAWFTDEVSGYRVVPHFVREKGEWVETQSLVDEKLYETVYAMAVSVAPEYFTLNAVLERLRVHSQVQIVQGKVIRLGKVYDPEVLMGAAVTIYCEAFVQRYECTQYYSHEARVATKAIVGEELMTWTDKAKKLFIISLLYASGANFGGQIVLDVVGAVRNLAAQWIRYRWFETAATPRSISFREMRDSALKGVVLSTKLNPWLPAPAGMTSRSLGFLARAKVKDAPDLQAVDLPHPGVNDANGGLWFVVSGSEALESFMIQDKRYQTLGIAHVIDQKGKRAVACKVSDDMRVDVPVRVFSDSSSTLTPYPLGGMYSSEEHVNLDEGYSSEVWLSSSSGWFSVRPVFIYGHALVNTADMVTENAQLNGAFSVDVFQRGDVRMLVYPYRYTGSAPREFLFGTWISVKGFTYRLPKTNSGGYTFNTRITFGISEENMLLTAIGFRYLGARYDHGEEIEVRGLPYRRIAEIPSAEDTLYVYDGGEAHGLTPTALAYFNSQHEILFLCGYENEGESMTYATRRDSSWVETMNEPGYG